MDGQTNVLYILVAAFFSGFAVGLNNKSTKKGVTFLQFVSEVLIHGISGSIVGAFSTLYIAEPLIVCAVAAIGGMFGQQLIKIITNRVIKKYLPTTKEKDDDDKDCL